MDFGERVLRTREGAIAQTRRARIGGLLAVGIGAELLQNARPGSRREVPSDAGRRPFRRERISPVEIRLLTTGKLPASLRESIRALLDDSFDGSFSDDDWRHTLGGEHVVAVKNDEVAAHAAIIERQLEIDGRRFRTGYVEGVATARTIQRQGIGSAVMSQVDQTVRRFFDLGALSTSHHAFYEQMGWQRWRGPTFVRRDHDLIRTAAEDGGIMVLLHGPSSDVSLTSPISCESRAGDDW